MKRAISITLLIIVVILGGQFLVTKLTKKHVLKYMINNNETKYTIVEKYLKEHGNAYDIEISDGTNNYYYVIANDFNKQKKIITNIEVYKDGNNTCIYPVLKNKVPSYIECISNGNLYSGISYDNQGFINEIKNSLREKGYTLPEITDDRGVKTYGNMIVNTNYLNDRDSIVLWQYKGIIVINDVNQASIMNNSFDKYENKLGVLAGKYYVMPDYTNQNVLETYSFDIVDLSNNKEHKLDLGFVLSSDTYLNGVVNNKVYYTDPSNLVQVEVDPKRKKVKVIGNQEMGGKRYINGKWEDVNIYDFTTSEIKFNDIPQINFGYDSIVDGGAAYYYLSNGNIYQLLKGHLDKPILMYRVGNVNNLLAISDEVFYVSNNTMYYLNNVRGSLPIFINNDLIYNTNNRVNIYRK